MTFETTEPYASAVVASSLSQEIPRRHAQHITRAFPELQDCRGLEAAVHEAILAKAVLARFPIIPINPTPEFFPGFEILFANEVARALPSAWSERHSAPWRAVVRAQARGKFQVHRRRT
jgi:hypothetical protein